MLHLMFQLNEGICGFSPLSVKEGEREKRREREESEKKEKRVKREN